MQERKKEGRREAGKIKLFLRRRAQWSEPQRDPPLSPLGSGAKQHVTAASPRRSHTETGRGAATAGTAPHWPPGSAKDGRGLQWDGGAGSRSEAARHRWTAGASPPRPLPAPPRSRPQPPATLGRSAPRRCRRCPQRIQRGTCRGRGHGGEVRHIRRAPVQAPAIPRDTAGRRRSSPRPNQVLRTRRAELPAVRERWAPPARPRTHARVRQPCPHTRGGSARSSARCVTAPTRARPPPRPARSARSPRGGKCHPGRAGGRGSRSSAVFIKQHSSL
ncbi:uncharacterized protein LOC113459396 [Zonotrichia albicollis]|uniref:uncharacterized protein LOC113459396 n=1 Tax=Zonotrichia albicollis TaxID=44394 RepID=UPI003D80EB71